MLRRSQTLQQQQHEDHIHKQFEVPHFDPPPTAPTSHNSGYASSPSSLRGKVKGFYQDVVKPASAEAMSSLQFIGSLEKVEERITQGLTDPKRFPEVAHVAQVRRGLDMCPEEQAFVTTRKARMRDAFARYLGMNPADVHPDDVPIVAFGGSGGGYRAMLGVLGYADEMKKAGLWDLFMYVAGVSGSCWSLAAYFSFAEASWDKLEQHCMKRLSPHHPLSKEAIRAVLSVPGGSEEALGPLVQKHKSGLQTVPMDLYSVFTTGYLFLRRDPTIALGGSAMKEVAGYHKSWLTWSSAGEHLKDGSEPMPILTAIRHARPWKNWVDKEHPFRELDPSSKEQTLASDAWFQWFEFTPYEIGCDELEAWVPTWGFGRPFSEGKSTMQLPEQSLALLLGLCTSAPAGPLTSYIATISRSLPAGFIGNQIHNVASRITKSWGKQETDEFTNHHPLHACNEHNYMFHLTPVQPGQCRPAGIENSPRIHLIDSGMDNNCPTYVLLHPARQVDVLINMDASSDVQKDSFQQRAEQIGFRRGLRFARRYEVKSDPDERNPDRFAGQYAQVYDGTLLRERPATVVDSYGKTVTNPPAPAVSTECTMIYMPLLPNERAVAGFDPSTAKFSGSYNLVWTPEQVQMLLKVCRANFRSEEGIIKEAMHEAWLRKRDARQATAGR
jgi:phospholipase A2